MYYIILDPKRNSSEISMKEKKHGSGGGNGTDKEEEKNGLEKLEDEFKGTIFNVLYVLLKDDETSHWKHILEILLDFI